MRWWPILISSFFASGPSAAASTDAAFLAEICSAPSGDQRSFCEGYLLGVLDTVLARYSDWDPDRPFCMVNYFQSPETRRVLIDALQQLSLAEATSDAHELVFLAAVEALPCD